MGPDEEKDYTEGIFMHYNPKTCEWEEVGKLKDIKDIKIDDRDCAKDDIPLLKSGNTFEGTFKTNTEYMVMPVKPTFDIKETRYKYIPVQYNNAFYADSYNSAVNGMIRRVGTVVKVVERERRRSLTSSITNDIYKNLTDLYVINCREGYYYCMPKIIDIYEPIDTQAKNYLLYLLIKVR